MRIPRQNGWKKNQSGYSDKYQYKMLFYFRNFHFLLCFSHLKMQNFIFSLMSILWPDSLCGYSCVCNITSTDASYTWRLLLWHWLTTLWSFCFLNHLHLHPYPSTQNITSNLFPGCYVCVVVRVYTYLIGSAVASDHRLFSHTRRSGLNLTSAT